MTATTDEAALLAAVHAAPEDDAPRLVLADHLEDAGRSDVAASIRDWVWRVKPLAVAAWTDESRPAPALSTVAGRLQRVGPVWRLAAVLTQRLAAQKWPVPYDRITAWPAGWDGGRHRAAVLDCRHAIELSGYGLEVDLETAAREAREAWEAAMVPWEAGEAAAESAATAAAESAWWKASSARAAAAAHSARLYSAVLAAHQGGE